MNLLRSMVRMLKWPPRKRFTWLLIFLLATVLTLAAIFGKQACSLGIFRKNIDRLSIGLGMIPRGEVGLIFANIGLQLTILGQPIISQSQFSAVVAMVIITTLITPPALKWSLNRNSVKVSTV